VKQQTEIVVVLLWCESVVEELFSKLGGTNAR